MVESIYVYCQTHGDTCQTYYHHHQHTNYISFNEIFSASLILEFVWLLVFLYCVKHVLYVRTVFILNEWRKWKK